mmetsp:Transcript_32002/g.44630  ORF Transcript_32002/g.44630 Transcript_32002/m.44630 type:complete len:187 (+) Transcript_32002:630-1190(+)
MLHGLKKNKSAHQHQHRGAENEPPQNYKEDDASGHKSKEMIKEHTKADAMMNLILDPFPLAYGGESKRQSAFDLVRNGAVQSIQLLRFQFLEHLWIMLERLVVSKLQSELGLLIRHQIDESLDTMIRDLDLEPQIKKITQRHKEAQLACMDAQKSEMALQSALKKLLDPHERGGDEDEKEYTFRSM